jgi:putative flavoprotein involved in K+ transport
MGQFDRTIDDVPTLDVRFGNSSHTSGTKGGHDIYLRAFARDGVTLLGRMEGADGEALRFATDVRPVLDAADQHAIGWRKRVDDFVAANSIDAPLEPNPDPEGLDRYPEGGAVAELDAAGQGITSMIWATGFRYDFSWIKLPVAGDRGFPVQRRGVTAWRGLYFVGLQWMYSAKSAQFIGVGEDAAYVAEHAASRIQSVDRPQSQGEDAAS